jgi:hypothetical protein
MYIFVAIMDKSMEVSQEIKNRTSRARPVGSSL